MKCMFCGHSSIRNQSEILEHLVVEISQLAHIGVKTFYSGCYGDFDLLALSAVANAKTTFPDLQNIIVTPYLTPGYLKKLQFVIDKYNAISLYPFEKSVLPKYAIAERNKWMVNNSDFVIAHVNYSWGGAATTLEYARKCKKKIIEI